jgi:type I restriction enzyme S subunit
MMDEKLPEGWVWTTIGGVAETTSGGTPARNHSEYYGGNIPWIKSGELRDGIINAVEEFLSEEGLSKSNAKLFSKGTALVAMYGATVGKTGILGMDAATNQAICALLPIQEAFRAKYITYWVQFQRQELINRSAGGAQPNINQEIIRSFPLPLPPLLEQHRIIAAIEQQFTRLDNAVASLQSAQARAKQYRASLLKAAVEGELTKEWRAEHPAQETGAQLLKRILTERRKRWEEEQLAKMRESGIVPKDDQWKERYKEPQGPDVGGLPELPEGWCWATVEQIAQIQGGIQKQPGRAPRQNSYPYLRVANVLRGRLDLSIIEKMELFGNELETLRLKSGDLLIVEGNGSRTEIGRSALWNEEIEDCVHQNHIIRVRLNHVLPNYVDFYWNSPEGNQRVMDVAASTTGLYTLSVNKISRLPVPLPPLAEQAQIVAEVEEKLSNIEQMEATIEHSLRRAEHERQSILRESFAGRLVAQDPHDEPASVLLAKIREERKRREAEAKVVKISRKGVAMGMTRKRRIKAGQSEIGLYQTLVEAGQPLPPDDLFRRAGLKADEQHEAAEAFYQELDVEVAAGLIREMRPDYEHVLLEAVGPPPEELTAMEEEETEAREQPKTLWDA